VASTMRGSLWNDRGVTEPEGEPVTQRYEGKVAVVNGAASGIGRAIVRRVVAEGGVVAAGDVVAEGLQSLQEELGDAVGTFVGDVTVEADAEALVALAVDRFGGLDAAFHVAGASKAALIVDLTEEDWDFTVDLCLKGVFFGIKHAGRRMIEQGRGGAIVNIASLNSRVPMFFGAAYSAAKAGVVSLGQSAALELGEHGIRVSTVSPGLTATPLVRPMTDVPAVQAAFLERIPLGRPATPDDIAASAAFLASDDAAYVSGVNLFVDGGWEQSGYPDLRPMFADILANAEALAGSAEPSA
jgi:meso-butanediol dehydrogenase / (S,S)-butanediol dehydrogenase / diacetyl reductase